MTPDDERRAAAVPGVPVADRLRALLETPADSRHEWAVDEALSDGADEVEMLTRELDSTWRRVASDGDLIRQLFAEVVEYVDRLAAAEALARGAQYREREALATVGVLRAREDARAEWDAHHDVLAASVGALDGVGAAGDLAALARREAGPVMRRQWRACARCGREHWLADGEAVPLHGWVDPWGAAQGAAVTVGEGSEGR